MSMELHVLFHGKLPSKAALTRCFKEFGFPLSIASGSGSLEQHNGYLPMRLRGEESGVEFDTYDGREKLEDLAGSDIDPRFTRSANFRWGGDEHELTVALCFAAALAKLVDGAVFDPQESRLLTVDEAIAVARKQLEATQPKSQARLPGTRPADIKRYLKPLLASRCDLVLVGRLLLIRPVRHILRGALFDRTSDRFLFRLWRYVMPLYGGHPDSCGHDYYIHDGVLEVWQPHFEPLLMALLAEDVFDELGTVTTLSDFAARFPRKTLRPSLQVVRHARVTSFVLAGETDRAAEYVQQEDRAAQSLGFAGDRMIKEHFERLVKDIDATCAECHAREAELIKAMKLEHIWEPSPFPVELPAAERASKTTEPHFVTTPWPARPPWLWQDLPQKPGEIRYAKRSIYREDHFFLVVALTAEEAEERHRALEEYVLAVRLGHGALLRVRRSTSWDRAAPKEAPYLDKPREPGIDIRLDGISHIVDASIRPSGEKAGLVAIESFEAYQRSSGSWKCYLDFEDGTKKIRDERSGETVSTKGPLTPAERHLAAFPKPAFGEYAVFLERVRSLLLVMGHGEVA